MRNADCADRVVRAPHEGTRRRRMAPLAPARRLPDERGRPYPSTRRNLPLSRLRMAARGPGSGPCVRDGDRTVPSGFERAGACPGLPNGPATFGRGRVDQRPRPARIPLDAGRGPGHPPGQRRIHPPTAGNSSDPRHEASAATAPRPAPSHACFGKLTAAGCDTPPHLRNPSSSRQRMVDAAPGGPDNLRSACQSFRYEPDITSRISICQSLRGQHGRMLAVRHMPAASLAKDAAPSLASKHGAGVR